MKKQIHLTILLLGCLTAGCRQGQNAGEIAPAPQVTLASFRGNVMGEEITIKEDPSDPFSANNASIAVLMLPGQREPNHVNLRVALKQKGGSWIMMDMPSILFREYNFEKIKQVLAPGAKKLNESMAPNSNEMVRYREGFDFIFSSGGWGTGGGRTGVSTIGDQAGSTLEVVSAQEINLSSAPEHYRAVAVTFKMNAKLYADSDQVYGEVKNAEMILKFYYTGPVKFD